MRTLNTHFTLHNSKQLLRFVVVACLCISWICSGKTNSSHEQVHSSFVTGTSLRSVPALLDAQEIGVELLAHPCPKEQKYTPSEFSSETESYSALFVFELLVKKNDETLLSLKSTNGDWIHQQKVALEDLQKAATEQGEPLVFEEPKSLVCNVSSIESPELKNKGALVLQWFRYFDKESSAQESNSVAASCNGVADQMFSQGASGALDQNVSKAPWTEVSKDPMLQRNLEPVLSLETNEYNKTKITVGFKFVYRF